MGNLDVDTVCGVMDMVLQDAMERHLDKATGMGHGRSGRVVGVRGLLCDVPVRMVGLEGDSRVHVSAQETQDSSGISISTQ